MDAFPTPEALWQRQCDFQTLLTNQPKNPFLQSYWKDPEGQKKPRYYQEVAVNRVIEHILRGDQHILSNLATGTGKTFIAMQLVWKLIKSGYYANKRILFLADLIVLRNQGYNAFEPFHEGSSDPLALIEAGEVPRNHQIYFGIYQALYATNASGLRVFETLEPDTFDLIIIDECHRSGFGTWNDILKRFPNAIQVGMTARRWTRYCHLC